MASACRSWSKRASTERESIPGLISLSATRRLTGSVWEAIQTSPMPPSPIFCWRVSRPALTGGSSGEWRALTCAVRIASTVWLAPSGTVVTPPVADRAASTVLGSAVASRSTGGVSSERPADTCALSKASMVWVGPSGAIVNSPVAAWVASPVRGSAMASGSSGGLSRK